MAGDIATRYVRIRPDASGFKNEANRQVEDALKGVKRTIAATLGGAGIAEILKTTFEAASGRQSAGAAVELAVKNAGAAWEVYGKTVADVLEEQEHTKGFDFEEQGQAFGRIEQQTKNTKRSLEDLNLAMDVSRARHLGLAQVAVALSRLEGGNAQSLSRLGITIDKYTVSVDKLKSAHDQAIAAGEKFSKQQQLAYKDALAAAKASDKQTSVEQARAELLKRYGGQADTFAHTAAGSLAILHTSVQQVQEAIGTAFLPLLTEGSRSLADWANALANSDDFQRKAAIGARDLGQAVHAIGQGIEAIEPLLSFGQTIVDAVGVGPILAFVAAWKLLPPVLALAGGQEAALTADTVALQGSFASLQTDLAAFSAQVAALGTEEVGLTATTAGLTAAQTEQALAIEANIAATEALVAVDAEATVASRGLGVSLAGMLGPISLLAAGLFFLHERLKVVDTTGSDFKATVDSLAEATRLAGADVSGAKIARDQASAQKDAAQIARDTAQERLRTDSASSKSIQRVVQDQDDLRDATLNLRQATHAYTQSVDAARQAERDRAKGVAQSKKDVADLTAQVETLSTKSFKAAALIGELGGDSSISGINNKALEIFVKNLDQLAEDNPSLSTAIKDLRDITEATHKIPDKVTIGIVLNPQLSGADLTAQIVAQVQAATQAAQTALSGGGIGGLLSGGLAPIKGSDPSAFGADNKILYPADPVVKKGAKKAAQTWSQEFVTHIDASSIGDAISSALSDARSNIVSQSDAIASAVGDALDERLRRTTLPLTREIESLQASLDAEQAANAATDAADAVTAAQAKLDQLRSVYGSGALTAGQSGEISDAQKAVRDAQQQVQDQAKQARISSLQDQIDTAGKAEELRKSAVTKNLSDLSDEFNRGKITQESYLASVRKILAGQEISFKSAGQLLGTAFASGFQDALKDLAAQVLVLTGAQRKGSTLTKPTSVTKAGADATQSLLDQIAQSGGKFTIDNADKLPKGVNVGSLLTAAARQRAEDSYRVASGKAQTTALQYQETTNEHLATIAGLLKDGTHIVVDGTGTPRKKTRATAKATQS